MHFACSKPAPAVQKQAAVTPVICSQTANAGTCTPNLLTMNAAVSTAIAFILLYYLYSVPPHLDC